MAPWGRFWLDGSGPFVGAIFSLGLWGVVIMGMCWNSFEASQEAWDFLLRIRKRINRIKQKGSNKKIEDMKERGTKKAMKMKEHECNIKRNECKMQGK